MLNRIPGRKLIAKVLLASFVFVNFQQFSYAGIVSTDAILSGHVQTMPLNMSQKMIRQRVVDMLANDEVRAKLASLGVVPELAKQRVDAMTDEEVNIMASNLDALPAGGDFLGTFVFLFLVLLATDILGFTDIFPFVKKTVR